MKFKLLLTILILTAAALVATAMPAQAALVSYWEFEEGAGTATDDSSPNSHTGTLNSPNGPTWTPATGRPDPRIGDHALYFDGTNDYVAVADADDLSFTDGSNSDRVFTFAAWVNVSDSARHNPVITKWDGGNNIQEWTFFVNSSGAVGCTIGDDSSNASFGRKTNVSTVTNDVWVHILATYNGSETFSGINVYINGVDSDTTNINSTTNYAGMENTSLGVTIGLDTYSGGSRWFKGTIDEIGIWNEALTGTEIGILFNNYGGDIEAFEAAGRQPIGGVPEPGTVVGVIALVAMGMRRIRRNKNVKSV